MTSIFPGLAAGEANGGDLHELVSPCSTGCPCPLRGVFRYRHAIGSQADACGRNLIQRPGYLWGSCARSAAVYGGAASGRRTGVRAVQCLEKQDCWNFIEENSWAKKLFDVALTRSNTKKAGNPRDLVKEPAVFVIDYNDGLKAAAFLLTGLVEDFTVAVDVEGQSTPVSTLMNLQNGKPIITSAAW